LSDTSLRGNASIDHHLKLRDNVTKRLAAGFILIACLFLNISCTDSSSVASDYLAKSKAESASANQEPGSVKNKDNSNPVDKDDSTGTGNDLGNSTVKDDEGNTQPPDDNSSTGEPTVPMPKQPEMMKETPKTEEPKTVALTYEELNTKFFSKYCVGCHGAKSPISLVTYAKVKAEIALVKEAVLVTKIMPEGNARPTAAELKMLSDWIAAGAIEK
jgi:hypothetical protein